MLYFELSERKAENTIFTSARTIANTSAEKKPSVLKSSINSSTNSTMSTVIMKEIKPRVKKFIGKVRIRRIVPIVAFASAIKTAAMIALQKLLTSTPGKRYEAMATAAPIRSNSMINFIFLFIVF